MYTDLVLYLYYLLILCFYSKVHNYSPAETKTYDKPVNRKTVLKFQPQTVLKELQTSELSDEEAREKLVSDYVEVKSLFLIKN